MLPLKIKKKRHECSVKGCKNRANVHIISRTADHTGCIYICDDCVREAYDMIIRAKADNDKVEGAFFDDYGTTPGDIDEDMAAGDDETPKDGTSSVAHKAASAEQKTAARGSRRK